MPSERENNCEKTAKFPHEIAEMSPEVDRALLTSFKGERSGFVQVGRERWFFPLKYKRDAEKYYSFEVRPTDTWVVTFPRSGTTLTQEMIWLIENDLDFGKAAETALQARFPFLEHNVIFHDDLIDDFLNENSADERRFELAKEVVAPAFLTLAETPGKRFVKTHLPFGLLPANLLESGAKVVYVARNPKDVAVSYYHLYRQWRNMGYVGDFENFWNYFENDQVVWAPYWAHVKEAWKNRHRENLLFMFYEDIVEDLPAAIAKVAVFLGRDLSDDQVGLLGAHLRIDAFKRNKSVNCDALKELGMLKRDEEDYIRKGKSRCWGGCFDGKLGERADRWIEANLEGCDLKFPGRL